MSHRSRRLDDRDRSHKYDKYEKYESRHRRDYEDSDHYSSRSRYRSRSRSSSRSYSRHHRSRSRSSGHSHSRHHNNDHHSRSHRSKDYRESQSKHGTASYVNRADKKSKYDEINESEGPTNISSHQQNNKNYNHSSFDTTANDEPKMSTDASNEPDSELEKEKQRIQRETMERLQKHFEKEGKAYPPPKPQASHPIFANDGSFLEIFKKTIQQQQQQQSTSSSSLSAIATAAIPAKESQNKPTVSAAATSNPAIPILPVKRRGAKILKTGIVQKQRIMEETEDPQPADSWNAYLKEVKRYKTVTCSDDNITRSLVK